MLVIVGVGTDVPGTVVVVPRVLLVLKVLKVLQGGMLVVVLLEDSDEVGMGVVVGAVEAEVTGLVTDGVVWLMVAGVVIGGLVVDFVGRVAVVVGIVVLMVTGLVVVGQQGISFHSQQLTLIS